MHLDKPSSCSLAPYLVQHLVDNSFVPSLSAALMESLSLPHAARSSSLLLLWQALSRLQTQLATGAATTPLQVIQYMHMWFTSEKAPHDSDRERSRGGRPDKDSPCSRCNRRGHTAETCIARLDKGGADMHKAPAAPDSTVSSEDASDHDHFDDND